jgi:drug/metabolite transporter (DMT)-like permease
MDSFLRGNALFALAAAVVWGGADFSGGMGVKSAGGGVHAALRVVLLSYFTSFTVLVAIARMRGDAFPHGALLAWGVTAGVAGGLALTCFYTALSRGGMGASAALSGLLAAAIPAVVTLWREGSPGALPLVGFVVAGLAIWLIAAGKTEAGDAGTMGLAMAAGVGFGFFFVALKMANGAGVIWPMATARIGSMSVCLLMLLGSRAGSAPREPVRLSRRAVGWALSAAVLDTSGNLLFLAATRRGRLDVAAVLGSLYPASTILLAAFALAEWPTRRQVVGMAAAVAAVVLIAI